MVDVEKHQRCHSMQMELLLCSAKGKPGADVPGIHDVEGRQEGQRLDVALEKKVHRIY